MKGIYSITNIDTGKLYIGSSAYLHKRWDEHYYLLKNDKHHCRHLQSAWNKYGEHKFYYTILELTDDLIARENFYINRLNPEYNVARVAGQVNPPPNKPIKRICLTSGEIKIYRTRDEAAMDGFNEGSITSCCLGRGGTHKGYKWEFVSEPTTTFKSNRRISQVERIDLLTGEVVEYPSMSDAEKDGFSVSEISGVCRGKCHKHAGFGWQFLTESDKHSRKKAVVGTNISTGETKRYGSMAETEADGFRATHVSLCALGRRKTHKGYTWKLV